MIVPDLLERSVMDLEQKVQALIEPGIEAMGFRLVRVIYFGGKQPRLQIMAERKDGSVISVDNCASISRSVSAVLDVDDPIASAYALEVSSPGIDRPLVREEDFERYAGFDIKAQTGQTIDGRKRFKGRLKGIKEGIVSIEMDNTVFELPYQDIHKAKLLLSDELIAASQGK